MWCADNTQDDVKIINPNTLTLVDTKVAPEMPIVSCFDGKYMWVVGEISTRVLKLLL